MFKIMQESIDYLKRGRVSGDVGRCSRFFDIFSGMSKNQKRNFLRYGKLPGGDCEYNSASSINSQTWPQLQGKILEGLMTNYLWAKSKVGDDTAQYLYKEIMKRKYPPRSKS